MKRLPWNRSKTAANHLSTLPVGLSTMSDDVQADVPCTDDAPPVLFVEKNQIYESTEEMLEKKNVSTDICPRSSETNEIEMEVDSTRRKEMVVASAEQREFVDLPFDVAPEVHQLQSLMGPFTRDQRRRLENIANMDPEAGANLVELLQAFQDFCNASLISQGQCGNMSVVTDFVQKKIEMIINTGMYD